MEFLLQFIAEFLIELLLQILMEIGLRSMADALRPPGHPIFSTIGFALWGALAGGLSLWVWPHLFITHRDLRLINLLMMPLAIAAVVRLIGEIRVRREPHSGEPDQFSFAFAFAFAMTLVRYVFAK